MGHQVADLSNRSIRQQLVYQNSFVLTPGVVPAFEGMCTPYTNNIYIQKLKGSVSERHLYVPISRFFKLLRIH